MSNDGYSDADEGDFCYIGFPWGSPSLTQQLDWTDAYYYEWIYEFFHNALNNDVTVNTALDDASLECFNSDFNTSTLHTGFTAYWAGFDLGYDCTMAVYGNGNIKLYQPELTVNTNPEISAQVYIDNQYMGLSGQGFQVNPGTHTIRVTEPTGYSFKNFTWTGGSTTNNPMTLNVSSDMTITAYYNELEYSLTVLAYNQYEQQGYVPLYIDDEYVGITGYAYAVAEGNHKIYVESPLWEAQYPFILHVFDHYTYDSTTNYSNPITLPITDDKTVTAYYITYTL